MISFTKHGIVLGYWDVLQLAFVCGGFYLHELNEIEILGNMFEDFHLLNIRS